MMQGIPAVLNYGEGQVIFSTTKPTAQSFRSVFLDKKPNGDARDHQHGDSDDYDYLCRADR